MKRKPEYLLISTVLLVLLGFGIYETQRKHIGGNVISFPIPYKVEDGLLPSPWSTNNILSHLLFRTLFIADHTLMNFSPDLASSYSIENAGYTYHVTLAEGNKWSDGTPITPEDVVFSIEAFNQQNDLDISILLLHAFRQIRNMRIEGNTIIFDLWDRHYNFLAALAQFAIMPKHALEGADISQFSKHPYLSKPLSSSMYQVSDFVEESHFVLSPNKHYKGKKPKIETVNLYFSYTFNDLDFFSTMEISDMTFYRTLRGFTEYRATMQYDRYFVFNVEGDDGFINERMFNKSVREAICYAIDNVKLVNTLYFQVGNTFEDAVAHVDGYYDYNPEKAKQLLLSSNFDRTKPLRIATYATDKSTEESLRFIANNLQEIGFLVEIKLGQSPEDLYVIREYDILYKGLAAFNHLAWYQDYDSAHPYLTKIMDTGPNFNALLVQANTLTDVTEHKEVIENLLQLETSFLYKFPIYSPLLSIYVNTGRVKIPKDIVFGNPWYIYDIDFANWEIIKN